MMALGYATLICRNTEKYFFEWFEFLESTFFIPKENDEVNVIDNNGDTILIKKADLLNFFCSENNIGIKVLNGQKNVVNCFLQLSEDKAYCYEEYTLDQLLADQELLTMFEKLNGRFVDLVRKKIGVGVIFDPTGYSEDYISLR